MLVTPVNQPPATIGRYQVISRIGRGGMGALYLALDPLLERQVAIKLLRDDMDELRERFAREARSVARLRHPNIVTVFDVGEENGQPFIAMEYIHGQTLADVIRTDTQLPVWRKLEIIDELCDGLAFAHKSGIVHRDIKPANVMVEHEGGVKILDFGIARIAESGMTMAGVLMGTLNYMSPEQVKGEPVDPRSDIFAVGAVTYELLSRKQAFPGGLHNGIINRIMYEPPSPLETLCPSLDQDIIAIVNRALEKDPQARYQDLAAMRKDLLRVRQQLEAKDDDTIILDGDSNSETVTVETPRAWRRSQVRRDTQREALERLRVSQVASHLESARRALEAGDFDAAIAAGEQALLLAPDDHSVHEVVDRARTALDERQVRELVDRGAERLQSGALTEAVILAEQALTITPDWPSAIELRDAVERLRLERARERERMEAVRAATERAQAAFEREAFEEALAEAAQALTRDPHHEAARTIQKRSQKALDRLRQLAFHRLAQKTADDARRLFEHGQYEDAVSLLTSFEGEHPHIAKVLDELRQEKARIDAEQQRAREERIQAVITRANATVSHEDAIGLLRDALSQGAQEAQVQPLLAQRQAALERERELARQAREREQKIAEGLSQAAAATSHDAAITILEKLLVIDRDRQDVVAMLQERKAALEREREEERRVRQRAKEIDAALTRAGAMTSHDEAVAILAAALQLDSSRKDVRERLAERQAALDREREEARLARLREQKIASAIAAATATPSHKEALVFLRHALRIDPNHAQLNADIDARQRALDRELEEAQKEQERQARIAVAIKKASAVKAHDAAIALLTEALKRDPEHPELIQQLELRRAALERQQQEENERRARVAAGIEKARKTTSHADAVGILKDLVSLAPDDAALRSSLVAREAALAKQQEEERRERERQERLARAVTQARQANSNEAAVAALEEAQALAPNDVEVRDLLAAARANLEQEREERRRERERQDRVASLVKQATAAASHETAITALTEVLQLDPGHRDAQRLLVERQAALEREQAEAKRRSDLEAARRRVSQLIAAGEFDAAAATLDQAERQLQARKLLKAERRQLKDARAAAKPATPRQGVRLTPAVGAALAAAIIVLLAIGFVLLRPEPEPIAGPAATPTPTSISPQTPASEPPPQVAPAEPATPPVATLPTTPPAPEPEKVDPNAATAARTAAAMRQAREQLQRGEYQDAIATISGALKADPKNQELRALSTTVVSRARNAAATARKQVAQMGARATNSGSYRDARARESEATRRERAGQHDQAVRLFVEATNLYSQTQRIAAVQTSVPAPPTTIQAAPAEPVRPEPTVPPTTTPPVTTSVQAKPPAPATPPVRTVPAPTTSPPPPPSDEDLIHATLREYAAAIESLRADAVIRVYPGVDAEALARGFRTLTAQRVEISNEQIQITGTTAVVRCRVLTAMTPRIGRAQSQTVTAEFRLQKADGRWIIVSRR